MDLRDRFYGFSLLFNIFAEKNTYYAGIMLDAPSIVLCSKLCRHNVSDPNSERAVGRMESSFRMRNVGFSVFLTCILPRFMINAILLDR